MVSSSRVSIEEDLMANRELFPYLCVRNAAGAIEFYKAAFGATEKFRLAEPGGRIGHAELEFGTATLMISEEFPEFGITAPDPAKAPPVTLHLHVDDADDVIQRALAAGATLERPAKDQFYGERSGCFRDPFGHRWSVGHQIEDVTPAEMQRRYTELLKG
jgi:PhnB protein